MVFRRDSKVDAFQRQISALRQQLGDGETPDGEPGESQVVQVAHQASSAGNYSDPSEATYGYGQYSSAVVPANEAGGLAAEAPPMPSIPVVDAQTTVISHDTTWKGEISSDGTVHIHGRFEGSIRATHDVFVAEEADVDATVMAARVVIAGLMKGTVRCGERFEVLPSGRVASDVQSPTLVVHEGAIVTGQFRMGVGELPETKPTPVVQRRAARGSA